MSEKRCSNCQNQMSGFDGGFFGIPLTCECKIFGETENRKGCSKFKVKITKADLLRRVNKLEKELEELQKELEQK